MLTSQTTWAVRGVLSLHFECLLNMSTPTHQWTPHSAFWHEALNFRQVGLFPENAHTYVNKSN